MTVIQAGPFSPQQATTALARARGWKAGFDFDPLWRCSSTSFCTHGWFAGGRSDLNIRWRSTLSLAAAECTPLGGRKNWKMSRKEEEEQPSLFRCPALLFHFTNYPSHSYYFDEAVLGAAKNDRVVSGGYRL